MFDWLSAVEGGATVYFLAGLYLGILFFCVTKPPMENRCEKLLIGGTLLGFWVCAWPVAICWLLTDRGGY